MSTSHLSNDVLLELSSHSDNIGDRAAAMEHLADCHDCRAELSGLREVAAVLHDDHVPQPSDELLQRIQRSMAENRRTDVQFISIKKSIARWSWGIGLAAAAGIAALVVPQRFQDEFEDESVADATTNATSAFDPVDFASAFSIGTSVAHAQQTPLVSSRAPITTGIDGSKLTKMRWSSIGYMRVSRSDQRPDRTSQVVVERDSVGGRALWRAVSTTITRHGTMVDSLWFQDDELRPFRRSFSIGNANLEYRFDAGERGRVLLIRRTPSNTVKVDTSTYYVAKSGFVLESEVQLSMLFALQPPHSGWSATFGTPGRSATDTLHPRQTIRIAGSETIQMPWGKVETWRAQLGPDATTWFVEKRTGRLVRVTSGERRNGQRQYRDITTFH